MQNQPASSTPQTPQHPQAQGQPIMQQQHQPNSYGANPQQIAAIPQGMSTQVLQQGMPAMQAAPAAPQNPPSNPMMVPMPQHQLMNMQPTPNASAAQVASMPNPQIPVPGMINPMHATPFQTPQAPQGYTPGTPASGYPPGMTPPV